AQVFGSIGKIELIREGRITFFINSDSLRVGLKTYKSNTKILCNIYDGQKDVDDLYDDMKVGNYAAFESTINRPKNSRNPYEFDYEKYLADRNISILATAYSTENIRLDNQSVSTFKNFIHEIRNYLDNKITALHNKTTEGLLRGLLLADRSGIDYNTNSDFMNAGVVHVLSVSGLHVGYIVIIFLFLFNRFNLYWRVSLTIVGLFIYMIITGSEAPVFRSTIMASVILITPFLGRESSSYNTLSLAAIIILLLNPVELFNPSFQLSFSAILALIIFFPVIKRVVDTRKYSSKFLNYFLLFLGSTFVAQIGTLPFTLSYFGRISLTSLAANFFVIPISGVIVGLG
ncbi:MAG: ComEC/Rec2 family competence protein, partial [Ignavibacteria bacterium]|nr:ComEC/Rec2 family competence protein [Ignavibacteria bacterium]